MNAPAGNDLLAGVLLPLDAAVLKAHGPAEPGTSDLHIFKGWITRGICHFSIWATKVELTRRVGPNVAGVRAFRDHNFILPLLLKQGKRRNKPSVSIQLRRGVSGRVSLGVKRRSNLSAQRRRLLRCARNDSLYPSVSQCTDAH